jgi:hypothetical protein
MQSRKHCDVMLSLKIGNAYYDAYFQQLAMPFFQKRFEVVPRYEIGWLDVTFQRPAHLHARKDDNLSTAFHSVVLIPQIFILVPFPHIR